MTTAIVAVRNEQKGMIMVRALLDSCSTVNLVTEKLVDSLKISKQNCVVNIGAVGNLSTTSTQYTKMTFYSRCNKSQYELNFLIVPSIATSIPNEVFPRHLFDIPKNLNLADPQFHLPKSVDMLLASSTTLSVLAVGQITLGYGNSKIILQKTRLGWIVAGGTETLTNSNQTHCKVTQLDKLIERFWSVEDFDHEPIRSRDEVACERHYVLHTTREVTGRYIVRLPFRDSKFNLGESRMQALKRFHALFKRLASNPSLKEEYTRVMNEYIDLGHMSLCDDTEGGYYLPHHAVIKTSSETTKVRVVFDASAKTSSGISLNDTLMVGPTLQNTIFEQVLRFRTHTYVITADIEKMYRQILIHPEDRRYQRVIWCVGGNLRTFELNTVTFGTAAAPFLAVRTLQQLAHDEAQRFPRANKLLIRDFYVDDFISGADSLEEILEIRDEMMALLRCGGFLIRQWASNHSSALNSIGKEFYDLDCMVKENPIQRTLGIIWDSKNDSLKYNVNMVNPKIIATKRKLLSELSKIFDPLGLLGPVVLYAKILMQDCWKAKISWDESLPQDIHTKWRILADQLAHLHKVSIPRRVLIEGPSQIELHGFSDASIQGYGACLYLRSINAQGQICVRLLCSKSRVAPLKGLTIPRLELCGASILKKLYSEIKVQLDVQFDQVILWSDSTIVLAWLRKSPHLLRTFESNRVADIQTLGKEVQWKHVRSHDNPADSLSRGQLPSEFINNRLWYSGPKWLSLSKDKWPPSVDSSPSELPGLKGEFV